MCSGAWWPSGAEAWLVQESAERDVAILIAITREPLRHNVRDAGIDFAEGELLLPAGRCLTPRDLALAAAANHPTLQVRRRPRVAVLATGDELVQPGEARGPAQIVASNNYAVAGIVEACGAESIHLGIAADALRALASSFRRARDV